jgi:lipopolysaccharide export system protein LptC
MRSSSMRMLDQETAPPLEAVLRTNLTAGHWLPPIVVDSYSRRVALLKRALPVVGVTLLLLIAGWTRVGSLLESVQFGLPAIDLREAKELRMTNLRYGGLDRYDRPYVVTAAAGRQIPDRNDVMALERPKAVMTVHGGASVVLTAATGIYQSQTQLLDLFGDVNLVHENGTRFLTQRAHLNLSDNSAEGRDAIEGHGPAGDITGEGFRVLSKGETITFTGESHLLFKGIKPSVAPAEPPAVPAAIQKTAGRIEAAVAVPPLAPLAALPTAVTPSSRNPAATPHAVKRQSSGKPAPQVTKSSKSAVTKVGHNAG